METPTQARTAVDGNAAVSIRDPKSREFYLSPSRRNALKELWFGLSGAEACVLTGEQGLGKTLLCRELLRRLPLAVHSIYTVAPRSGDDQSLLDNIEQSVALSCAAQEKSQHPTPQRQDSTVHLAIIVDAAQRLSVAALQRLAEWRQRAASANRSVGLLLIGPPALAEMLARPDLRYLNLQITVRCELPLFGPNETQSYIEHWLKSSMASGVDFSAAANRMVFRATAGVPEEINQVCLSVLDLANTRSNSSVTALTVARAIWKTLKLHTRKARYRSNALKQADETTVIAAVTVSDPGATPSRQDG